MTRAIGSRAALVAAAALLLGVVGSAGAGGPPPSVFGVPCSDISTHHLDMQTNVRAYLVVQGCGAPGTKLDSGPESVGSAAPLAPAVQVGGTDRDVISSPDTAIPHDTQAESMVAAKGDTIVVDYFDSRDAPSDFSGASLSTDGGNSWTRIDPFATGHGTNYGDPLLVYNRRFAKFIAGDLVGGCGTLGIGTWTSGNGQTWAARPCVHSGTQDAKPSIAVDNDPASPFYGNTYVSWNDFIIGSGALVFSRSTDGGVTWSAEQIISNTSTFLRNTQLAVQPANGQVDLVGVDEGGGGFNLRTNYFFRSQNGGVTWSSPIPMGASFPAAGDTVDGSWAGFHHVWRAMGWGNPVPGGPTTIVYPYYRAGFGDSGDVYAVRSIDGGATWSAPIAISTAWREQWFSQAVSNGNGELAIWYYSRENTTDGNNYEIFLRKSHDGGATWTGAQRLSDVLIDEPVQNDGTVQPFFAGDYNVTTSDVNGSGPSNRLLITWTDARNTVALSPGNYDFTATTGTIGSDWTPYGNHCDDCATAVDLPFPFTFYGTSYSTAYLSSNGLISFLGALNSSANQCLPMDSVPLIAPYWDDLTTANHGFGWFTSTTGTAPSRVFTLREDAKLVNSTTEVHFEVRLHENSSKFEIVYGALGSDGGSATAGVESGGRAKQIECNSAGVLTSGLEEKAVYNPNESVGTNVHSEDVEFDQVPLAAKITARKALAPTTDSGRFNLLVGSTVVATAAGSGGSGTATVSPGTFTVKESPSTGSLADYVSSIACTKNGVADVSGTGTSLAVTVAADDVEVCTITNKRRATITLRKSLSPTSDTGKFNLIAGSKTIASDVGNGGSGSSSTFAPDSYTLKETAGSATTLANYTSSIACKRNGGSGPSGNGTSLTVTVAPADLLDCTFTNVRKAKITVTKSLSPTSDPGRFNLLVGSTNVKSRAGNGGSGSTLVTPGSYTVSENAASGTSLSNYTSSIVCTKNGSPHKSGPGTSISVSVAAGDVEACTITNVRK